MAQDVTQNLGLLKAIVIGLSIAIVACLAVMAAYIVAKVRTTAPDTAASVVASLPRGAEILETQVVGNAVLVRTRGPQGDQILTFDLASGRQTATLSFVPSP
jgi:anti-sigma-K factor RskA